MTLDQLRIFVAVAQSCHMTRAADELGMTQSAVSAAVNALEKRYGVPLFDRLGRGITLTDAGRRFLPEAKAVLDRAASARAIIEDLSGVTAGSLAICASQTIATYWLPKRLAAFHTTYPGIRLDVSFGNTSQVEASVAEGSVDLGLVEGPTSHMALLRQAVDVDRLVLVTSWDSPAPPSLPSGALDLEAIAWVIRETGSGTRAAFESYLQQKGIEPDKLPIFLVLPSNEAVREAVAAGAGATIISQHVVARDLAAKRLRAIEIDLPAREFALLRHRDRYQTAAQSALMRSLLNL